MVTVRGGAGHSEEVVAHFAQEALSASGARRVVSTTLEAWGRADLNHIASLLVSELVANVVLHARTGVELRLRCVGERIRVEVHDGSPRLPERKHYSATAATGRGLVLVERLALAWGTEPTATGKAVWFELEGPPATVPSSAGDGAALALEAWADPGEDDLTGSVTDVDPGAGGVAKGVEANGSSHDATGRRHPRRRPGAFRLSYVGTPLRAAAPARPRTVTSAACEL